MLQIRLSENKNCVETGKIKSKEEKFYKMLH